ncbi:helix-turn-helix transcriptional regulator [Streptomyces morookaense]|uniref:helix-turn-helix domain-containing protein n=1 Tax=Streptomyces morookaense TaxID=1970 RepID=UPI00340D4581
MGQQAHRTARRRRLGAALRHLRETAGITAVAAAEALHGDGSKISRIETGRHRVTLLELDVLMGLYAVREHHTREWLIALASEERGRSWWRQPGEPLSAGFKEMLALESSAASIGTFQAQVVPGLLQTRAYATALINGSDPLPRDAAEFYVDLRMERQAIFRREVPPSYLCILTEGVLHQHVGGPTTMAEQLRHMVDTSRQSTVTILVIPYTQTAFPAPGCSFIIFSHPAPLSLDVVAVEALDGARCLEDDEAVAKYHRALDRLRASALTAEQSVELIASIAHSIEHE